MRPSRSGLQEMPAVARSVDRRFSASRRYLCPFTERLLLFSSALVSLPGHVPPQEVNSATKGNVLAFTPTSEITRCSALHFNRSSPKAANFLGVGLAFG